MTYLVTYLITIPLSIFGIYYGFRCFKKTGKPFYIIAGFFCVPFFLVFGHEIADSRIEKNLRGEFKNELLNLSNMSTVMLINNDSIIKNKQAFINELRKVDYFSPHHSSPIEEFQVLIKSERGNDLELSFSRDSQKPYEYWINYKNRWIGRIQTTDFKYFKQ